MLSFPDIFTLDASDGAGRVMFTLLLRLVLSFSLMRAVVLTFSAVPCGMLAFDGVLFEVFLFEKL